MKYKIRITERQLNMMQKKDDHMLWSARLGQLVLFNGCLYDEYLEENYFEYWQEFRCRERVWVKYGSTRVAGILVAHDINNRYLVELVRSSDAGWDMKESDMATNGGIICSRRLYKNVLLVEASDLKIRTEDARKIKRKRSEGKNV